MPSSDYRFILLCILLYFLFSTFKLESGLKKKEKQTADECSKRNITESSSSKERAEGGIPQQATDDDDQMDEPDWEEGPVNNFSSGNDHEEGNITVEFEASPDTAKRKAICRASAEDKVDHITELNIFWRSYCSDSGLFTSTIPFFKIVPGTS